MTVQEQAAMKKLPAEANEKDFSLLAACPKWEIITSLETKETMAPAKRKAGTKQVRTWTAMYSFSEFKPAEISSIIKSLFLSEIF